jgi:flagellin-like hook-associated protein FlgL
MSGTVGSVGLGDYGALGAAIANAGSVRTSLDTLTQQIGSGLVAQDYAGLGQAASQSIDLVPVIAQQQTWQGNIDRATASLSVTQNAMSQIQAIASSFYAQLDNLNGLDGSEVDTTAASARQALQQVAELLDTTDGQGNYVFAGQDSANAPVPSPDAILGSGFYTQINAAVGMLATSGSAATAASTLATASSNAAGTSPFSTYMSQAATTLTAALPAVQIGDGQAVQIGLSASANSFVASTGGSTTGSYMRDLMRALATIGSLSSGQITAAGFSGLVQDTRTSLNGAISAMASDVGVLGNVQAGLADTKTRLGQTATALTTQVSNVQNVDQAAAISKLQLAQTQLESSYQLIATLNGLSLAKFLPAG